jgi:hypothetical protein
MTFQSSFLIRCRLALSPDSGTITNYYVQHVQTGAEFGSASFSEVMNWITAQNREIAGSTVEDAK